MKLAGEERSQSSSVNFRALIIAVFSIWVLEVSMHLLLLLLLVLWLSGGFKHLGLQREQSFAPIEGKSTRKKKMMKKKEWNDSESEKGLDIKGILRRRGRDI